MVAYVWVGLSVQGSGHGGERLHQTTIVGPDEWGGGASIQVMNADEGSAIHVDGAEKQSSAAAGVAEVVCWAEKWEQEYDAILSDAERIPCGVPAEYAP